MRYPAGHWGHGSSDRLCYGGNNDIRGLGMANERIILLGVMIVAGVICGMMFNIALDRKIWELGGLTGGAVVGFLMWLL